MPKRVIFPPVPRRTLLDPETQTRRSSAYVPVPYVATIGAYQGPGFSSVLCDWSVPPGEHARTVRVVGCNFPGLSTKGLGWYFLAVVEYQLGGLVRKDTFRWSCAGWSRLLTADAVRVSFVRFDQSGLEAGNPQPPANGNWMLGASVLDGPLASVQTQYTVDCPASATVVGTRIPVGATRVRLDVDNDYSLLYAGWADDPGQAGGSKMDNMTALEAFALFPDQATDSALSQRFAAQMFADWRAVDDLAGMVAVERVDADLSPSRWRWVFEVS